MPSAGGPDWSLVDVAVPRPAHRLPGVAMAGFCHRAPTGVDITMVAHPSVTLFLDLSAGGAFGHRGHGGDGGRGGGRGSFVTGLAPGGLRIVGQGAGTCLQIRLEPVVAAGVLDGAGELGGEVAPLAEMWGTGVARLEDRLRATSSWDERFAIATTYLGCRLRTRVDPEVARVWHRTAATRGRARIDDLAAEVGWSRKRLWSRFRAQLGVSPKRAARLVRFDDAAHLLAAGVAPATVATETGYADQSHLHHDVRDFTGTTPTAVAAAPWLQIDDVAWPRRQRSATPP